MMTGLLNRWRARRHRIFVHRAGGARVAADPVATWLALHRHKSYLPRHLDEAISGNAQSLETAAQAACDVFGVKIWSDDRRRGLTLVELLELLVAFDGYAESLRRRFEHLADSVALYGGDATGLWRTDYETYAGLWFNRHRSHVRIADAARLGIAGAFSERSLGWFVATSESHDEALAAFDQHRADMARGQSA